MPNGESPPDTARMTPDEIDHWETNGYFMRENVFSHEENDQLRQVAEEIAVGKRKMPTAHIDQNAQGFTPRRQGQALRHLRHAQNSPPQLLYSRVP